MHSLRVLIYSDLHREFSRDYENRITAPEPDLMCRGADLVILAGDTDTGLNGVRWARRFFEDVPVLYVLGNHEYYGNKIGSLQAKLRDEAAGTNIVILDDDTFEFRGYRFFGSTLWTDFALWGNPREAMSKAGEHPGGMSDFRRIRRAADFRRFRPADATGLHARSVMAITQFLQSADPERSVVITHHAPSPRSLTAAVPGWKDPMDAAYASNLEVLIEAHGPALWVHGHIHTSSDYRIGATRIVCNPRGYPDIESGFNASFTVDLPVEAAP